MGKQQKVNVREWLDQCAPDEVRDAIGELIEAADRCVNSVGDLADLRAALAALSEPQA